MASKSENIQEDNPQKVTTKRMIEDALTELKSKKGVSYYAIKKYIEDNYNVNMMKTKHLIKKQLKSAVDEGTVLQIKGTGASGSFKLAPVKVTTKTKDEVKSKESYASDTDTGGKGGKMKTIKKPTDKPQKPSSETKNNVATDKKSTKAKENKGASNERVGKTKKISKNNLIEAKTEKVIKGKTEGGVKEKKKSGKSKDLKLTVSQKRALMMRRKSIGSIIKPPRMKPKLM